MIDEYLKHTDGTKNYAHAAVSLDSQLFNTSQMKMYTLCIKIFALQFASELSPASLPDYDLNYQKTKTAPSAPKRSAAFFSNAIRFLILPLRERLSISEKQLLCRKFSNSR